MATNPNMVAIQTVTVPSGGAASIEFTDIPQTYTDLKLVLSSRKASGSETYEAIWMTFNDATNRYYEILLYNAGGGAGSASHQNSLARLEWLAGGTGGGATASTFGNSEIYIPNYTSSVGKSVSGDWVSESNSSSPWQGLSAGLWDPTSNAAITSIKLFHSTAGNFAQYSTATLYGIKNS
jgi:hypothetical protein